MYVRPGVHLSILIFITMGYENWVSKTQFSIGLFLTLKIFIMDGGWWWMDGRNHVFSFFSFILLWYIAHV